MKSKSDPAYPHSLYKNLSTQPGFLCACGSHAHSVNVSLLVLFRVIISAAGRKDGTNNNSITLELLACRTVSFYFDPPTSRGLG